MYGIKKDKSVLKRKIYKWEKPISFFISKKNFFNELPVYYLTFSKLVKNIFKSISLKSCSYKNIFRISWKLLKYFKCI